MREPGVVEVVDSHTGGEPTRVILSGGPDLGGGPLAGRLERFRREHDAFRSAVVNEPRGSDVLVGALLCPPVDPSCAAGVIFFDNAGPLGMCGHGMMGLVVTLARLGRIGPGEHRIETPVGVVTASFLGAGRVRVGNVPSRRHRKAVTVEVPGRGPVTGDVAWGGNWFFLVDDPAEDLSRANVERLTARAWAVRQALAREGVTGAEGKEIDHVAFFGPSRTPGVDGRDFVLCPGKAYDRSPCGTGTSARVACLFEDGRLKEGQVWRQEGVTGSVFEAWVTRRGGELHPVIQGSAHVTAEARLILDPEDPFVDGLRG